MSRATSGMAISSVNSARRFSTLATSASINDKSRGFLMMRTRVEPSTEFGAVDFFSVGDLFFFWTDWGLGPPTSAEISDLAADRRSCRAADALVAAREAFQS